MSLQRFLPLWAALGASLLAMPAAVPANGASIKIGVLSDLSGPYAPGSGMGSVEAVRMAAAEFGNTVAGMPIEVISADMQNKPDVGSAIARHWLDVENVDAIIDIPNSAVALAVQEIIRVRPDKLLLATAAASSDLVGKFCSPNFHRVNL